MTVSVTHQKVSAIADDPASVAAGEVVPSDWNAAHVISGTLDVANGGTGVTTSTGTGSVVLSSGPTLAAAVVISGSSDNPALTITQTGAGPALLIEDEASTDATPIVVNNAGSVIVGSTTQPAVGTIGNHKMTVAGNTGTASSFLCYRTDVSSAPSAFTFGKTRGTDPLNSGDAIGRIEAAGRDATTASGGDERSSAARITFAVDGTPALDSMPGRISFETTPSGSNAPLERMRIDNAGNVGIGAASAVTGQSLTVTKSITGATSAMSIRARGQIQSDVTSDVSMVATFPSTAAATFTLANLYHFIASQNTIDAASTVTNQWGIVISSNLTGATNNYGINSAIASAANRWNLYISGTAPNYFAGNIGLGTTSFGTSATNTFSVLTGTAPTTGPADTVQFYSTDLSAGNTIPSFYTEGTNVGTGTPTANRTIAVRFNGTVYYLLASTIP